MEQHSPSTSERPGIHAWTAHPLRDRPGRAACAVLAVLAVGLLVAMAFREPTNGMLAAGGSIIFLLLTLNRFFLPSAFTMDDVGIAARYPLSRKRLQWSDVRRFGHDRFGGHLYTRARGGRWANFGGMPLLFGRHGGTVIPRVQAALENS